MGIFSNIPYFPLHIYIYLLIWNLFIFLKISPFLKINRISVRLGQGTKGTRYYYNIARAMLWRQGR